MVNNDARPDDCSGNLLSAPMVFRLAVFSYELFMRKYCIEKVHMVIRGGKVAQTQSS